MRSNTISSVIDAIGLRWLLFTAMLALGIVIPSLGLPQPITGPLVNALLIVTVETVGLGAAISLGMLTPFSGLIHGVLPLPMMIMLPFIAVSNALLVVVYHMLRSKGYWRGLVPAAIIKFGWLFLAVMVLAPFALGAFFTSGQMPAALPTAMVSMMTWPQLVTALAGGLIARGVIAATARFNQR